MMTQSADKKREQLQMFCIEDMVPQDHLLRLIDKAIDWSFISNWSLINTAPITGVPA